MATVLRDAKKVFPRLEEMGHVANQQGCNFLVSFLWYA